MKNAIRRKKDLNPFIASVAIAPCKGDVVIDVPPESQVHRQVVRKALASKHIELSPLIRRYYVEVQEDGYVSP
ncbi:MAG: hypothetical protein R2865_00675 [Deinococcales bacterium]